MCRKARPTLRCARVTRRLLPVLKALLMLAAANGCEIDVICDGTEAEALMDALATLVGDRFGEGR